MADFVSFVAGDYTGRSDPLESDRSLYWHQMVQGFDYQRIGLIGFASHEGVKRNLGRIGAISGPTKIRQFFAKLPITPAIQDTYGQLNHLVGDAGGLFVKILHKSYRIVLSPPKHCMPTK